MQHAIAYLLVNFGGPRSLSEVEPFLRALLTDQDVVRTGMPQLFHNFLFHRVAKKRAPKLIESYAQIGGKSPIYEDTEGVAKALGERTGVPVLTFHRYLPETHRASFERMEACAAEVLSVFPLFPQFTYATTGSIARLFTKKLSPETRNKLKWVKSYPTHPAFIGVMQRMIREFLEERNLKDEETILLFSAHGLPQSFIDEGDLYQIEVEASFQKIMTAFPKILGKLSYQSKFGPGEWLRPYTNETCESVDSWNQGHKQVVIVPISFTSDHIETLFEIEEEYLPILRDQGVDAYRLPALNRRADWIEAIKSILEDFTPVNTSMLVRRD